MRVTEAQRKYKVRCYIFHYVAHSFFTEKNTGYNFYLLCDVEILLFFLSSVAILTARIRNYQEHLQKHHKVRIKCI